jgi:predicted lipoprotein with Yx(FWY)xxD motif
MTDGTIIKVNQVVSDGPGWVAIYSVKNGNFDKRIGIAAVTDGINEDVKVSLEPGKATDEMIAVLLLDKGTAGEYDPEDAAVPGSERRFQVTRTGAPPILQVADQDVGDGTVNIKLVDSPIDGWVVIYSEAGSRVGDVLGVEFVRKGQNPDLKVTIDPGSATGKLIARLHIDGGEKGKAEIRNRQNRRGADDLALFNGEEVRVLFTHLGLAAPREKPVAGGGTAPPTGAEVTPSPVGGAEITPGGEAVPSPEGSQGGSQAAPVLTETAAPIATAVAASPRGVNPAVQVQHQAIKDGSIQIDQVVSDGPGWVVIWTWPDNIENEPEAIGRAQVKAGETLNVSVPVEASKATPRLVAVLHNDGGQPGNFEADQDLPVQVGILNVQMEFSNLEPEIPTATQAAVAEPYILVEDQPLRGGKFLIISEVFARVPGWIGIHLTDEDGNLTPAAIGARHVEAGLNQNLVAELDSPLRATEKMFVMLHIDDGQLGIWEGPGPPDEMVPDPAQRDKPLVAPFFVTGGAPNQAVKINLNSGGPSPYLVDGQGFSLYTLSFGVCEAQCLEDWAPLLATGKPEYGAGVNGQKFSVVGLGDGNRQVTYGTLPLYYYLNDYKPGDINGHLAEGGAWVLAAP